MRLFRYLCVCFLLFGGPAQAETQDKLTLLLDWFPNPDHAPLYVALEKGFFARHGLDVEMIAPANPADPPKIVAAGKADLAVSYQPQLHMQVDEGLPLVRIATLVGTPLNCLIVLADSPYISLKDLKGKSVGFSVSGIETMLLDRMLADSGISANDVKKINVNFSLSPSLISGKVDAVIGSFRNFELSQMELEGKPGRAFFVEEHGVPSYDELIVVAKNDRLEDDKLKRFVCALEDGVRYLVNHPQKSWQLFIKGRPDLDTELNRRAWKDTLPRFALRPGALDVNGYRHFGEFLKKHGVIKNEVPVERLAVELQ